MSNSELLIIITVLLLGVVTALALDEHRRMGAAGLEKEWAIEGTKPSHRR